jgi:hypothetical protein
MVPVGRSTNESLPRIDYRVLVAALDRQVEHLTSTQVMDGSRTDTGGFVSDDGLAGRSGVGAVAALGYAYLLPESTFFERDELFSRIDAATRFGRVTRRSFGRFDLVTTNFDSAPDTAFVVQALAPLVKVARGSDGVRGAAELAESVGELVQVSVPGLVSGGFHTPNHRWVILSALAQALELFPDLDAEKTIRTYLAEGIDINEDGDYTERSAGVYNAICNRSLRLAAASLDDPDLLVQVRKNLDLCYHLLNADGTIVTSLSSRQDRGRRVVPTGLIDSYYYLARLDGNGFYAAVADWLWAQGSSGLPWVLHPFMEHPEWRSTDIERDELPGEFTKVYARSGLWRHRTGRMSASVAAHITRPVDIAFGHVESLAVKICSTYFATGQFRGEQFQVVDGRVRLRHLGRNTIYTEREYDRPVYWLPVGRTVKSEDWRQVRKQRSTRELEPLEVQLETVPVPGGLDLRIVSSGGVDSVPFQLECLFSPGGVLELDSGLLRAEPGGTAFLKAGFATYRIRGDVISLGPGNLQHRMWDMRNSEAEPDAFRLLIALMTPVDWTLEIRCFRATAAEL